MAILHIEVGQRWVTRSLEIVRVNADRSEYAILPRWRWALSNGQIVDEYGRADYTHKEHPSDLLRLYVVSPEPEPKQSLLDGMDSMSAPL